MDMIYCNTRENPVITLGYPGISATPPSVCRTLKKAFNPVDAERAAVLLMAELAVLKLDQQIFRRNLPADKRNGLALTLTGESPSPQGFRYREFHVRLSGRNENPETLLRQFSAIRAGLPGEMFVQVSSIRLKEPVSFVNWEVQKMCFEESSCSGAIVMTGTMELTVQICFAP